MGEYYAVEYLHLEKEVLQNSMAMLHQSVICP